MIFLNTYNIIIPLITENDIWSFINPFRYEIWIFTLISIPVYILAMGVAEYIADRHVNWEILIGFVMRNVCSDPMGKLPDKRPYQKILVIVWVWSCFVLVMAFAGNLTAMLIKPKIDKKFTEPEHFLDQDEMTLVTEVGAELKGSDSVTKKLLLKTEIMTYEEEWESTCFTKRTHYSRRHASICDNLSIQWTLSDAFEYTRQCKWYTMNANIMGETKPLAMAFQVI